MKPELIVGDIGLFQQAVKAYQSSNLSNSMALSRNQFSTYDMMQHILRLQGKFALGDWRRAFLVVKTPNSLIPLVIQRDYFGKGLYVLPWDTSGSTSSNGLDNDRKRYNTLIFLFGEANVPPIDADVVYYPVVDCTKYSDFHALLHSLQSNFRRISLNRFYGERSKQVAWHLIHAKEKGLIRKLYEDTQFIAIEHACHYIDTFQSGKDLNDVLVDTALYAYPVCPETDQIKFVAALDTQTGKYIGWMVISIEEGGTWNCAQIVFSHTDAYTKYGLALSAHLAVLKYAIEQKVELVNLGLNFDDCGQYKDIIPHTKFPLCGVPTAPTIDSLLSWVTEHLVG